MYSILFLFVIRFSGITDEDLEEVTTSLRDVQAVLLSLVTDKTILMGHSLESDLTAVKVNVSLDNVLSVCSVHF